ncbi:MAG: hypothetical protein LQ345_000074 [Seirophora villosa]|nr:MAG: hypothetical protein LQ345_000074 [Seirophora villosa]
MGRSRITDDYHAPGGTSCGLCLWDDDQPQEADRMRVRDDAGSQSEKAEQHHEAAGMAMPVPAGCWNMLLAPSGQTARDSIHPDQSASTSSACLRLDPVVLAVEDCLPV